MIKDNIYMRKINFTMTIQFNRFIIWIKPVKAVRHKKFKTYLNSIFEIRNTGSVFKLR